MRPRNEKPDDRQVASRQRWAKRLMRAIEARNMTTGSAPLSIRGLSKIVGTSHQAPIAWMAGTTVPAPTQVVHLAEMAGWDVSEAVLEAEMMRTTDRKTAAAFRAALKHWRGMS